ncbi:MAG TPA: hypothetical protein VH598_15650 [Verrucomicrobiae bacterium]|jgi:hypothetical protein|nr:hypothetical protein [Verrucomicrobiae bacterium]
MKPRKEGPLPTLAKGQLWKTDTAQVEITEVGKTLAHYRLLRDQKRAPISLGRIEIVRDYLLKNHARLVKNARLEKMRRKYAA